MIQLSKLSNLEYDRYFGFTMPIVEPCSAVSSKQSQKMINK